MMAGINSHLNKAMAVVTGMTEVTVATMVHITTILTSRVRGAVIIRGSNQLNNSNSTMTSSMVHSKDTVVRTLTLVAIKHHQ